MAGYISIVLIEAAATNAQELVAVPVIAVMEAVVFSVGACILATCVPLRKISKMNIVDSIETVE